jgi:hypothetical protein
MGRGLWRRGANRNCYALGDGYLGWMERGVSQKRVIDEMSVFFPSYTF